MVFYFLAYRGAVQQSREVAYIAVGTNNERRNDIEHIDDIFRRKTIRIKAVKFRGWCLSPVMARPDDNPDRPVRYEETLGETVARMRGSETLDDVMKRGASVRYVNREKAKEDCKAYGLRKQKVPKKKREVLKSPTWYGDEISFSEGMMEEPKFSSSATINFKSRIRVKTLKESLENTELKRRSSASVGGSNNNRSRQNYKVHFGTVGIRQYERCLGDNPACSVGAPVSIGWKYRCLTPVSVDQYEESANSREEDTSSWTLSSEKRELMLLSLGYSLRELTNARFQIKDCQRERYETIYFINSYQYRVFGDRVETLSQCFRKLSAVATGAA